jgi:cellulose synthase/poly-beta-1,6-N-acetylglucosamine synthase-like glycosyltransferase
VCVELNDIRSKSHQVITALGLGLAAYIAVLTAGDIYLILVHVLAARRRLARERAELAHLSHEPERQPSICIQLPVHNEAAMVARAIDAACRLDWPRDRLEIQVLDDASTDETPRLAAERIAAWSATGTRIHLHSRADRSDYKAGLLREGLELTAADYVAVFDVDYWPAPGVMRELMVILLADARTAFVQARLDYHNREHNWLTRAQATELDTLIAYEHAARNWSGIPMTFSGTCAVWRREAIEDAGGWSGRSLTEDLDLSLRALARGWRSRFLASVHVAGELPQSFAVLSAQRLRWGVGTAQQLRYWPWALHRQLGWHQSLTFLLLSQFHATVRVLLAALIGCIAWSVVSDSPDTGLLAASLCGVLAFIVLLKTIGALLSMRVVGRRLTLRSAVDIGLMWCLQVALIPIACKAAWESLLPGQREFRRTPKKG